MKLCWLVPDDRGGGVISVASSCVRQARAAGHEAVLLLMLEPTGWLDGTAGLRIASLNLKAPACEAPCALLQWLEKNPQDFLFLNGAEQVYPVVPHLPISLRCLDVIHDTAARYWRPAVALERELDGIVAVSHCVAAKFSSLLTQPEKLRVVHNGSIFPPAPGDDLARPDDLLFLGGDNPVKGAFDVLRLWPRLIARGFGGHLHWFGKLAPAFEKKVARLPAADRILRPGRTRREAIFAAAARAKVLLMLSRAEPFGMATIEGMSMGCVPVAWDIPAGTREIIGDEPRCFVPLGDDAALAARVPTLCAEHAQLAPRVRQRARQDFGEETMWRGYAEAMEQVRLAPPPLRPRAEEPPPDFIPARRRFQILPASFRSVVRNWVGRSPRLGHWLGDQRGL